MSTPKTTIVDAVMRPTVGRQEALDVLAESLVKLGTVDIDELQADGFEGVTEAEIVRDWVRYQYSGSSNQLLGELYELVTQDAVVVEGDPDPLDPCPCCGLRTLTEPDGYDICRWCGWEDDGRPEPSHPSSVNGGATILDYRAQLRRDQRLTPTGRWIVGWDVDDSACDVG